ARTGIRIVAVASEEAEAYSKQEEVSVALSLLAQHEPIRMRRVSRSIRLILIGAIVRAGVYVESRRICVLNTKAIPVGWSRRDRLITIAALVVHEATHGLFSQRGIPYSCRAARRIERVCERQQTRVAERLNQRIDSVP